RVALPGVRLDVLGPDVAVVADAAHHQVPRLLVLPGGVGDAVPLHLDGLDLVLVPQAVALPEIALHDVRGSDRPAGGHRAADGHGERVGRLSRVEDARAASARRPLPLETWSRMACCRPRGTQPGAWTCSFRASMVRERGTAWTRE